MIYVPTILEKASRSNSPQIIKTANYVNFNAYNSNYKANVYYDQNTNLHFKNIINEPVIEDFDLNQNIKMACIRYKMNPRKKDQFIKVLKAFSLEFKNSTAFALSEYVMFAYDSLL